jgi:hypothetical protein
MPGLQDAKMCPWCERWCLKDAACNYIFACGLETSGQFHVGTGCGRSWCWECGKKFCTPYIDSTTGRKFPNAIENHGDCCQFEAGFIKENYCGGGHNSHCNKRW